MPILISMRNVEIVSIEDVAINGNGSSTHYQQFIVSDNHDYIDKNGIIVEQQSVDLPCSTFKPEVIKTIALLKKGDMVDITGYAKAQWRGYKPDNTLEGKRFVIPQPGTIRPPQVVDATLTVYPMARPYELDKKVPNHYFHQAISVIVHTIAPATEIEQSTTDDNYEAVDSSAIAQLMQGDSNTNETVTMTKQVTETNEPPPEELF